MRITFVGLLLPWGLTVTSRSGINKERPSTTINPQEHRMEQLEDILPYYEIRPVFAALDSMSEAVGIIRHVATLANLRQ